MNSRGRKIFIGFMLRNAYMILNIVLAFFMMPFILHHLGDRMYGLWVLIGSFMGYIGFLDLGLTKAVSRFIAHAIGKNDQNEINEIANTAFFIYLVLSGLVVVVTAGVMAGAGFFVPIAEDLRIVRFLLLCVGINFAFGFPVRAFAGIIGARLEYKVSETILIAELLLRNGLIFLLFNLGYGILALGAIVCGVSLLTQTAWIVYAFKVDRELRISFKFFKRERVKSLMSLSFFVSISRFAGLIIGKTDSFVITIFIGLVPVAHYAIAYTLMSYLGNFLARAAGLIGPVFGQDNARGDREGIIKKVFLTTKIFIYMTSYFALLACFYGKEFIERWVGMEYLDAYPVLIILAMSVFVSKIMMPADSALLNTFRHKFVALAGVIEAVCNLILSVILVQKFGMVGVAWGTAIPMLCVRMIIQPIYMCKKMGISWRGFILGLILKNGIISIGLNTFLFFILRTFAAPDYGRLISIGIVQTALFVPVVWFCAFSKQERDYLLSFANLSRKKNVE